MLNARYPANYGPSTKKTLPLFHKKLLHLHKIAIGIDSCMFQKFRQNLLARITVTTYDSQTDKFGYKKIKQNFIINVKNY